MHNTKHLAHFLLFCAKTKGSKGITTHAAFLSSLLNYGLFSVVLIRYCQLLAAFGAARSQHATTILRCHALAETMLVHAATVVGLKCSFHCSIIVYFVEFLSTFSRFGVQKYA